MFLTFINVLEDTAYVMDKIDVLKIALYYFMDIVLNGEKIIVKYISHCSMMLRYIISKIASGIFCYGKQYMTILRIQWTET